MAHLVMNREETGYCGTQWEERKGESGNERPKKTNGNVNTKCARTALEAAPKAMHHKWTSKLFSLFETVNN